MILNQFDPKYQLEYILVYTAQNTSKFRLMSNRKPKLDRSSYAFLEHADPKYKFQHVLTLKFT